jgi:hypothetical protein
VGSWLAVPATLVALFILPEFLIIIIFNASTSAPFVSFVATFQGKNDPLACVCLRIAGLCTCPGDAMSAGNPLDIDCHQS